MSIGEARVVCQGQADYSEQTSLHLVELLVGKNPYVSYCGIIQERIIVKV